MSEVTDGLHPPGGWLGHGHEHAVDSRVSEHQIEVTAKVYLVLDPATNAWALAGASVDGHPLDETDYGVTCDFRHGPEQERADCEHLKAGAPALPTAVELLRLLRDAYDVPADPAPPAVPADSLSYHVQSHVTGARQSQSFGTVEAAIAVCRELNTPGSGGEYGVYDNLGRRVP